MKKIWSMILSAIMVAGLAGCAGAQNSLSEDEIVLSSSQGNTVYGVESPAADEDIFRQQTQVLSASVNANSEEMRGVWLAYVNYEPLVKNKTKSQYTANMRAVMKNIADAGFNTVFFQVRPFGDAMYPSAYFPWSRYLSGTEGTDPGYDPFGIVCALAKENNLRVEAWINPYRVRIDSTPMSAKNPAKKWLDAKNSAVISWQGGLYYNPADEKARKLITDGVVEIVKNYDVDGIHFDDYFYPTANMSFDAASYQASGSKLSQADWRRENVNKLVRQVYAAVKKADANCLFGISPQGNMKNNYESQFIDCAKWLSNTGYVDYICPQVYFGFENDTHPYAETVAAWDQLIRVDGIQLYVGVAAYKLGAVDKWAGNGQNEWISTKNLLSQMVTSARESENYGGVALYSYDSLFSVASQQVQAEKANLEKLFN